MPFDITPYSRYDRDKVFWLYERCQYLHSHLEWRRLEAWLDDAALYTHLAWAGDHLAGVMMASPPHNGASWLRAIVVQGAQNLPMLLDTLWLQTRLRLLDANTRQVGALILNDWLEAYLPALGFQPLTYVVTLMRDGPYLPPPLRADLLIREVKPTDLDAVRVVDNAAFVPLWQYTARDLHDALTASVRFTAAEMNGRIVGYQLCTEYQRSIHLVRLATLPQLQGVGVGGMLLGEAIEYFLKRRRSQMTVNTQFDNPTSLQLYRRFGFAETGYSVPVWAMEL